MDQNRRQDLIAKLKHRGRPGSARALPLVSLEDFFIGNDDISSIGCNLLEPLEPQMFYDVLRAVRSRPNVQDVLVEIMEINEEDESIWPFCERIYILAEASASEVASWIAALQTDEAGEGYEFGIPASAPPLEPGKRVFSVWWD